MRIFSQVLVWGNILLQLNCEKQMTSQKIPIEDIIRTMNTSAGIQDLILILNDHLEDGETGRIVEKISSGVMGVAPMLLFTSDGIRNQENGSVVAKTGTLLLYVFASETGLPLKHVKMIEKDLHELATNRTRPKILVLTVSREESCNIADLLKSLWARNFLDVVVIESILGRRKSEKSRMIVHEYDPFANIYAKRTYTSGTRLFKDEFPDMKGYPVRYNTVDRPPYSDFVAIREGDYEPCVDEMNLRTLGLVMNFTPIRIEHSNGITTVEKGATKVIRENLEFQNVDTIATIFPITEMEVFTIGQYSQALQVESWCFHVPKIKMTSSIYKGDPLVLGLVIMAMVAILWFCSKVMKFERQRWYLLRVMGMLVTMPTPTFPRLASERILFLTVYALTALYTSTLFAQLTSIMSYGEQSPLYSSFEQLMDTQLVFKAHASTVRIIMQDEELRQKLESRGRKIVSIERAKNCIEELLNFQNVSCFMDRVWGKFKALTNMDKNEEIRLERTDVCLISPPAAYVFKMGSPYLDKANDVFLRTLQSGLRNKWYKNYLRSKIRLNQAATMEQQEDSDNKKPKGVVHLGTVHLLVLVAFFGYGLSFLVFIGELARVQFQVDARIRRAAKWLVARMRTKPKLDSFPKEH